MKEDYLWDKTGGDPEIERLENALAAYRFQENAPPSIPSLPAKVLAFEQKPARRYYKLAFAAAAACLVFAAAGSGFWFGFYNDKTTNRDFAKTTELEKTVVSRKESEIGNSPNSLVGKTEVSTAGKDGNYKQTARSKFVKAHKNIQPVVYRKEAKTANVKAVKTEILLTAEERYAYDQLRLALSITSSKLKLVKNKVESVEEKNVARKGGR